MKHSESPRGIDRRRLIAAGGLTAAGAAMTGAGPARAADTHIPPDARPGGAYDRFVAQVAAEGRFSGVVLLAHRGRTVLSRSYGLADRERGVRHHENIAFNLSSASQPFLSVAVLQLLQQGRVVLSDTVGRFLTGVQPDIAASVTIHHLLTGMSGMDAPMPDWQRVFHSREEVQANIERWISQAVLVNPPGSASNGHLPGSGVGLAMAAQIVATVSGMTFWDYVHEHVFARAGMNGSGYYTRDRWLTDARIAHPYMLQADGGLIDAVRNLDKGSVNEYTLDRNPGRAFIGHASGDAFATAPDLVRFATAVHDGTLLDRPHAGLFAGAKLPGSQPGSFHAYTMPTHVLNGQWMYGRGGGGPGIGGNWNVYPDTGWVGVVLTNTDGAALVEICMKENEVVTGGPVNPPGGG
ncbi:CubicO group peptidase (beta-lactamase class C family) [Catenuloplanes nepalensis]|uniref:CubicO group peptidase (Beta-lactamase class C family) n=1 Tax=Catenuloplanes nepalensis TaxID=587533 RepID=A0ABT9MQ32_9ACTN|nr:serine hydrolase domain-containing protein [Catenuloplanes nepalensis]MDP9793413.1 CubicO group peptidase (beta-lactamase class C family) [Catenuloplanes nepalensis]